MRIGEFFAPHRPSAPPPHPCCSAPGHVRVLAGQQGISNLALVSRSDQEVLHRWLEGTGAGAAGGLDL